MKKLKILVSAYACNPSATEESYPGEAILGWNLVMQLSRFHDILVITRGYNQKAIEEEIKKGNISNATFFYLDLPKIYFCLLSNFFGFRVYYLFWQIKAYFLARRLNIHFKFDVFHQITFNNDWMPSFIGALLPIPFIWGPVGGGQRVPLSLFAELSLKNRIYENARQIGQWFWRKSIFRKMCERNARAILVCNQETERKFTCSDKKIYFFAVNGISPEELSPSFGGKINKNIFYIFYAGRFDAIKGLSLGIKSFAIFTDKHKDSKFIIIGQGPEESRLKKLAHNLDIESKVNFIPWLSRKRLIEEIRKCDVLFFPSFRDGGGAIVVEAMANGKPVICLDIGGPGFHIQEEWGIKIAPINPDYVSNEAAKALEKLYLDKDLRIKMGIAARKRAEEFYLWDRLGERLQDIYKGVLKL